MNLHRPILHAGVIRHLDLLLVTLLFFALLPALSCKKSPPQQAPHREMDVSALLADKELQDLGQKIFFDASLSTPEGQACATCHAPEVGWTGPSEELNKKGGVYEGALGNRFGNRKPNASAYATLTPIFHATRDGDEVHFVGGDFWDGRATGMKLGNPAADQAEGPFLNPVEQNNPDAATVVAKVLRSSYAGEFRAAAKRLWSVDDPSAADPEFIYGIVALTIAAFEHSPAVNQFSSKYDHYLKGEAVLTEEEQLGLKLFEGKAKCANCHVSRPGPRGERPLFTDFSYDNLGFPKNPDNPWYRMPPEINIDGERWIDPGLAGFLKDLPQYAMYAKQNLGKHRVPTLRNVDLRPRASFVKAFGHNGYFRSLESIVHFYNTRDVLPASEGVSPAEAGVRAWPPPEVPENVNRTEMGNLGLTAKEEAAVVAFLKTLSDGHAPER